MLDVGKLRDKEAGMLATSLETTLQILHDSEWMDPRDKLHGIVSFLEYPNNRLRVDYTMAPLNVFPVITGAWYEREKLHDIEALSPLGDIASSILPETFDVHRTRESKSWLSGSLTEAKAGKLPAGTRIQPWLKDTVLTYLKHTTDLL
jgi:hypothetical protein